jgi:23S rRNA (pseudouridine1915-N3)-methyltransferase
MRIIVAAVGRGGADPGQALFDHYARRITFPFQLKEVSVKRALEGAALMKAEGELLLGALPDGATRVALDARGRTLDSAAFAKKLGSWRDQGVRDLGFVIGGADGLDAAVTQGAGLVLSLGPMIWPHLLVRGMLAEQIYRAQCILSGHPYHRA